MLNLSFLCAATKWNIIDENKMFNLILKEILCTTDTYIGDITYIFGKILQQTLFWRSTWISKVNLYNFVDIEFYFMNPRPYKAQLNII